MKKPTTAVIFAIAFGLFVTAVTPKIMRVWGLEARSNRLEKELLEIKRENQILEHQLKLLREDPVYLERVARSKFRKAKEGEIVYKIEKDPQNQPGSR